MRRTTVSPFWSSGCGALGYGQRGRGSSFSTCSSEPAVTDRSMNSWTYCALGVFAYRERRFTTSFVRSSQMVSSWWPTLDQDVCSWSQRRAGITISFADNAVPYSTLLVSLERSRASNPIFPVPKSMRHR